MCLPFVFNCSLWKRQQETHPSTKFQSSCRRFFQRKPKKHLVNSYCDCHVWLPTFYGKHILQRPQFVENIGLDMPHSHGNPMSRTALNLKRVAHKEGPSLVSGPPNILYIYIWSIWCSNKKGCTAILFIPICTERKKQQQPPKHSCSRICSTCFEAAMGPCWNKPSPAAALADAWRRGKPTTAGNGWQH